MSANCARCSGGAVSRNCATNGWYSLRTTPPYISFVTFSPSGRDPKNSLKAVCMRSLSGKPAVGMPSLRLPCTWGWPRTFVLLAARPLLCLRKCAWFVVPGSLHWERLPLEVMVSCEKRVLCDAWVVAVVREDTLRPSSHWLRVFGSSSSSPRPRRPRRFFCSKTSMGRAGFDRPGSLAEACRSRGERGGPLRGSSSAWAAAAAIAAALAEASLCRSCAASAARALADWPLLAPSSPPEKAL
mmetsp:Transcript_76557/g.216487  ORF Transcript_76557/g.216487 Transcript_76557/m.216487 type:complete len:242 (-) Transcript_76557:242-967(-)